MTVILLHSNLAILVGLSIGQLAISLKDCSISVYKINLADKRKKYKSLIVNNLGVQFLVLDNANLGDVLT